MNSAAQATVKSESVVTTIEMASPVPTAKVSGFTLGLIANIIWGTSFLASKYTLVTWGPFTASALRFAVALIVMAAILPRLGHSLQFTLKKTVLLNLFWVALTGFGFLYPLQLAGLNMISSGLSAAIMLTSPLFVLLLAGVLLRESISLQKVLALTFGVVGGCILLNIQNVVDHHFENVLLGSLLTLGASISLALSVIFTRRISEEINSAPLTFWSMLIGLMLLMPFAALETVQSGFSIGTFETWATLLYLAVICSALCFLIWNWAIAQSSPKELATTMHVKTPAAIALGAIVLGEALSFQIIVGTLIVAFGVYLSQSEKTRGAK